MEGAPSGPGGHFMHFIKTFVSSLYRDTTDHHARQTSMSDNNIDCLRIMWLYSKQEFRKHSEKKHENNRLTETIHDFFIINEDGKKWSFEGQ